MSNFVCKNPSLDHRAGVKGEFKGQMSADYLKESKLIFRKYLPFLIFNIIYFLLNFWMFFCAYLEENPVFPIGYV